MNSNPESSDLVPPAGTLGDIETLGAVVHPHDIEVQDFESYGLVLDVRRAVDHALDHVPGAVCLEPADMPSSQAVHAAQPGARISAAPGAGLPAAIELSLAGLGPDSSVLVYCGRGGRDSQAVALQLRARGHMVDVLPGGYINYRRWVIAGLELLPRMVSLRLLSTALDSEAQRVLAALSHLGHQAIDVDEIVRQALLEHADLARPLPQAFFESLLLQSLRSLDPRRPVWVADAGLRLQGLVFPRAVAEAFERSPVAQLAVPMPARMAALSQARRLARDPAAGQGMALWLRRISGAVELAAMEFLAAKEVSESAAALSARVEAAGRRATTHRSGLPELLVTDLEMATLVRAVADWVPSEPAPSA